MSAKIACDGNNSLPKLKTAPNRCHIYTKYYTHLGRTYIKGSQKFIIGVLNFRMPNFQLVLTSGSKGTVTKLYRGVSKV